MTVVRPLPPERVTRILVIKLRAVGDVLLSTVVLDPLRAAFPAARIDMLTEAAAHPVVHGNPALDEALVFDPKRESIVSLFFSLRRRKYDLVIDLFCNPRSAQMTFATGAPVRVGFPFRGRAWAYTHRVPPRTDIHHNTQFNLEPLRFLGLPVDSARVHIPVSDTDRTWAQEWVAAHADGKSVVALNPSGTWESKRWGLEQFAELGNLLIERHDVTPLILWGPGEFPDVLTIERLMRYTPLRAPETSLKRLAALLSACHSMITNDTGPMHIGAAVGIPVLGLFGPTNPLLQGPWSDRGRWIRHEGLECLGCAVTTCTIGHMCMRELSPQRVLDAWERMIRELAA